MPTLTLKNLPAALHRKLKARAALHGRSLNAEAIACLRAAAGAERIDAEAILYRARALRGDMAGRLTDADLARLKAEGRP